jgi:peptidoglycan/xylan/chitin deacetylase (PgdA/CDA1 family)
MRPLAAIVSISAVVLLTAVAAKGCSRSNACKSSSAPCCSQYGYCGSTREYCSPAFNCQSGCWSTDETCQVSTGTCSSNYNLDLSSTDKPYAAEDNAPFGVTGSIYTSCRQRNFVALTFDDGPGPYTSRLLSVLRKYGVKATFFVLGQQLSESGYSEATLQAYREGHVIGSHSWSHPHMPQLSNYQINQEIDSTTAEISRIIGRSPKYFRPPYGEISDGVVNALASRRMKTIMWNYDSLDWQLAPTNPSAIYSSFADNLIRNSSSGSYSSIISLMHDTLLESVMSVERIIVLATRLGYTLGTLEECLGDSSAYL